MAQVLLVSKRGAMSEDDFLTIKSDLERMGHKVAMALLNPSSQTHEIEIRLIPQVPWWKRLFATS